MVLRKLFYDLLKDSARFLKFARRKPLQSLLKKLLGFLLIYKAIGLLNRGIGEIVRYQQGKEKKAGQ